MHSFKFSLKFFLKQIFVSSQELSSENYVVIRNIGYIEIIQLTLLWMCAFFLFSPLKAKK